jgi:hypothetical protein
MARPPTMRTVTSGGRWVSRPSAAATSGSRAASWRTRRSHAGGSGASTVFWMRTESARLSRMPRQLLVLHDSLGTLLTVGATAFGIWGTVSFWLQRRVGHRFRLGFLIVTGIALLQVVLDVAFLAVRGAAGGGGGGGGWASLVTAAVGFLLLAVPYVLASRWSREGEAATLCIVLWLAAMVFAGGLAV